jgi:hypothetical protein
MAKFTPKDLVKLAGMIEEWEFKPWTLKKNDEKGTLTGKLLNTDIVVDISYNISRMHADGRIFRWDICASSNGTILGDAFYSQIMGKPYQFSEGGDDSVRQSYIKIWEKYMAGIEDRREESLDTARKLLEENS